MFTQCTNCQAVSHINMEEIDVTNGLIRCSECLKMFDSSENLSTEMKANIKTKIENNSSKNAELEYLSDEHLQIVSALDDWQNTYIDEPEVDSTKLIKQNHKEEFDSFDSKQEIIEDLDSTKSATEKEGSQTTSAFDTWGNTQTDNESNLGSTETIQSPIEDLLLASKEKKQDSYTEKDTDKEELDSFSLRRSSLEEPATSELENDEEKQNDTEIPDVFITNIDEPLIIEEKEQDDLEELDSFSLRRSSSENPSAIEANRVDDTENQNVFDDSPRNIEQPLITEDQDQDDTEELSTSEKNTKNDFDELNTFGFRRRNSKEPLTQKEKRKNDIDDPFGLRRSPIDDLSILVKEKSESSVEVIDSFDLKDTEIETLKSDFKESIPTSKTYVFLSILLGILLISQLAFNYRHFLLGIQKYEPEKVHMLNHNIFAHPIEKGVLLISAAIENQADFDQSFPILEVRLNNTKGELVALRRFSPTEYLESFSENSLLPTKQATKITLKIKDPGNQATRFQFDFL